MKLEDVKFHLLRDNQFLKTLNDDTIQHLILLALMDIRQLILDHSVGAGNYSDGGPNEKQGH